MKATYNGVTMEGSPLEIAELKQLLDQQCKKSVMEKHPYPYSPCWYWYHPNWSVPTWTTMYPQNTQITSGGTTNSGYIKYSAT